MDWQAGLFVAMWACWGLYWTISAGGAKRAVRWQGRWGRLAYTGALVAAALLMALPSVSAAGLGARFVARGAAQFWGGAAACALGLGFAAWARRRLGGNWSGTVTIKQGHELVCTGPYALVRHPIYSGLLLAFAGSALGRGEWRGVVAVLLVGAALWSKLRLEEAWLAQEFGAAYAAYRARTAALIPFVL
ncbi:MAG: isoprenylcysteine carboxylmethyltransferase family protein [Desulfovibrionaceae bacterium]|jgi:protein-S-isoprenylcysteine O-methyltransferase Ste14|nr:isoprenylcysteine carboxylmethyltransferase family protein [Desulfovibrionaceae bacterium]